MDVRTDHLTIEQGNDLSLSWPLKDVSNGPLVTLGYTAKAQVRRRPHKDSELLHEWSTDIGNLELYQGYLYLRMDDSEIFDFTSGWYSVVLTKDGVDEIIAAGHMTLIPQTTVTHV